MIDKKLEGLSRFFFGGESDAMRHHRAHFVSNGYRDSLLDEIAAIGTDREVPIPEENPRPARKPLTPIDPKNDPDVIWPEIKLTPYDRARRACRALENEMAKLTVKTDLSQRDHFRLYQLPDLIEAARKKQALELKRADEPEWRKRRTVDDFRSTDEGKASRRKVRTDANSGYDDLSSLNDAEKKARKDEQTFISNTRQKLKKKKMTDDQIKAEIAKRLEARRAKYSAGAS